MIINALHHNKSNIDVFDQFVDTTAYILGSNSYFLLGFLNSKLTLFFFANISSAIRGGYLRWKKQYVEQIPIPATTSEQRADIESLVTRILALKRADKDADTLALEAEVDALVYRLYGLTEAEVGLVEGE